MNKCFFGIDTSNYTTSLAAVGEDGQVILDERKLLPVPEGGRGLRQSEALFAHVRHLGTMLPEAAESLRERGCEIAAAGVSSRPRSVPGSYMPCFLAGVLAARSFASGCGIPLFEFSHQQGHVAAALFTSEAQGREDTKSGRFIAFHVSGGTTEVLSVKMENGIPDISLIGGTADLNAGQAVDRVGVAAGFGFPCGPAMEKAADAYAARCAASGRKPLEGINRGRISVRGVSCNLSGLENMAVSMLSRGNDAGGEAPDTGEVSYFVFDFIARTLCALAKNSSGQEGGDLPVIWAGGVMSNAQIKKAAAGCVRSYFAAPGYSSDNAAGIAMLARERYLV